MDYSFLKTFSTKYPKGPYSANPQDKTSIVFRNKKGYNDKIVCPEDIRDHLILLLNSAETFHKIMTDLQKPEESKQKPKRESFPRVEDA